MASISAATPWPAEHFTPSYDFAFVPHIGFCKGKEHHYTKRKSKHDSHNESHI